MENGAMLDNKNKWAGSLALSHGMKIKIGKPHKIQENASGWWSWYNAWWGSQWRGGMSQNVIQNVASPSESDSSIALGQIKVNAKKTVSFELEQYKNIWLT